ncbi:MAG: virulence plasmid 65kDa B protein/YD repeat protein [uncultured bacterium (gcode 4)]|uniref:Virulence plasmid 65kDa B protein/YD repeat protein n=1 Tax=uncultured bacterium (gcode 4) TaxID=1234023 RepID=K2GC11_9BACT|nr:MAG: virulence plasmid 65kDa B protein/YD repeat protein [uncultured bacterium (gcode 4)]
MSVKQIISYLLIVLLNSQTLITSTSAAVIADSWMPKSGSSIIVSPVKKSNTQGLQNLNLSDLFMWWSTYSTKFDFPKASRDSWPNLNITYSSSNRDGSSAYGYWWWINISSISRTTRFGTDKIYASDEFLLDGKEYIRTWNSYHARYANDSTKLETFSGGWLSTDSFGVKKYYGLLDNSRLFDESNRNKIFSWMLEKEELPTWEIVLYSYSRENWAVYPISIKYWFSGSWTNLYELQFTYISKTKSVESYRTNFPVKTSKLLSQVSLNVNWAKTKWYECKYDDSKTVDSHLLSVQEITSEKALSPTVFSYGSGKLAHLLTKIILPSWGISELAYTPSSQIKTADGKIWNPNLPLIIMLLSEVKFSDAITNSIWKRTFSYEWWKLYQDEKDPFRREYVGFQKAIITENDWVKQLVFFHQGTKNDNTDTYSKKWMQYRTEIYTSSGVLIDLSLQTYVNLPLEAWRVLVKNESNIDFDFGSGWSMPLAKATTQEYDSYWNVIKIKDFWSVVASTDSTAFTDTWSDILTTEISYATWADDRNMVSYPILNKITWYFWETLSSEKKYYDLNEFGIIWLRGLDTRAEKQDVITWRYIWNSTDYDSQWRMIAKIDELWRITNFTPDEYGIYSTEITNAKNFKTKIEYDYRYGLIKKIINPNKTWKEFQYDSFWRLSGENTLTSDWISVELKSISYNFNESPRNIVINEKTTSWDKIYTTHLDSYDKPIQTRKSAFLSWKTWVNDFGYDHNGQLIFTSYPYEGDGFWYLKVPIPFDWQNKTYDALGRLIGITDNSGTYQIQYWPNSQTITDRLWYKKKFVFDSRENLSEVHELNWTIDEAVTQYEYTPLWKLSKYTDSRGNIRNLTYDWLSRLIWLEDLHRVSDTDILSESYQYDDVNNTVKSTDQNWNITTIIYDELNRPLSQKFSRPNETIDRAYDFIYDQWPNAEWQLTTESWSTHSRIYSYNTFWKKSSESINISIWTSSWTYVTNFEYAPTWEPTKVTYPDWYAIDYWYKNWFAETVKEGVNSNLLATINEYSPSGKAQFIKYWTNINETYGFDSEFGYRLSTKKSSTLTGSIQDLAYTYDSENQITELVESAPTDANWKISYSYDWMGRLIQARFSDLSWVQKNIESYSYDSIWNILDWPMGNYTYSSGSPEGNPHTLIRAGNSTFSYDKEGNLKRKTEINSSGSTNIKNFAYDAGNRVIWVTDDIWWINFSYTYDAGNIRLWKRDYDENKLTIYPNDLFEIEYDKNTLEDGTKILTTSTDHHVFFAGSRIVTRQDKKVDTVSAVGWNTSTSSWSGSQWDSSSSWTVNNTESWALTGSWDTTWSGNLSGSWITDIFWSWSTTDTWSITDSWITDSWGINPPAGDIPIVPPADNTGSTTDGSWVVMIQSSLYAIKPQIFLSLPPDSWLVSTLIYHLTDHLGSAVIDVDENGNILNLKDYFPYWNERISKVNNTQSWDIYKNRYSYSNKERDQESNLLYFENRYYDSWIGRFAQRDPVFKELWRTQRANELLSDPQQFNSYSYARNNPVRWTDPTWEKIEWRARPLSWLLWNFADHSYIYVRPDDKNYTYNWWKMGDSFTIGWHQEFSLLEWVQLKLKLNNSSDKGYKDGVMVIDPKKYGMTEKQFITNLLDEYVEYDSRQYLPIWDNCNRSATSLLNEAGASLDDLKKFNPELYHPGIGDKLNNNIKIKKTESWWQKNTGSNQTGIWTVSQKATSVPSRPSMRIDIKKFK